MNSQDVFELLLSMGEIMLQPSLQNLTAGPPMKPSPALNRSLRRWEAQGLIRKQAREAEKAGAVVYRLTEEGRRGVEDCVRHREAWDRVWDGRWRVFIFDLPQEETRLRMMLWRWLREHRFGYLQGSVWISPDPIQALIGTLDWFRNNPEQFMLLQAEKLLGVSDSALVSGAWDIMEINTRYEQYLHRLGAWQKIIQNSPTPVLFAEASRDERLAYARAVSWDPLLPRVLWPPKYLGERACSEHQKFRHLLRQQLPELC